MIKIGVTQQKILVLLMGGITLSLSGSQGHYARVLKAVQKEWRRIDQRNFNRSLRSLCEKKLLKEIRHPNGMVTLKLTDEGKLYATYTNLFGRTIKIKRPKKWDRLWRLVMFDIPEKKRAFRNILRDHLKTIGFIELQKSAFVFPFPCEKEIACLTELYNATQFIRIATVQSIDNEKDLKQHFFKNKALSTE
jgi:CRISPR-associated endonuclease Cas2